MAMTVHNNIVYMYRKCRGGTRRSIELATRYNGSVNRNDTRTENDLVGDENWDFMIVVDIPINTSTLMGL